MQIVRTFVVVPSLPENLHRLQELALNLWWTFDHEAIYLFRRMDYQLWEDVHHNPLHVLGAIEQERLEALARDDGFLSQLDRVWERFQDYMEAPHRFDEADVQHCQIAYFSAEFGLTECVPIYSGGLGMLAGDHIKSASDLGLPLVGVGLLYREGYFRQYLNADGWQQETYPDNDFYNMPCELVSGPTGAPVRVSVRYPAAEVQAQIWKVQVGRIPIYLLDTNLPDNDPAGREITAQLYGGDEEMRIRQEILLGIGGVRALAALGIQPTVCHMNEGHSAFLALERIRRVMEESGCSFREAREAVTAGNVFTTHTPVPAGNDTFEPDLVDRYLSAYYPALGLSREEFLCLGRTSPGNRGERFCMTTLAIRLSSYRNGVSRLHGEVSRRMWKDLWPGTPLDEVPISAITNGVHTRSWVSNDLSSLLDRYLGPRWTIFSSYQDIWDRVEQIPDEELWRTHERRRERMVAFARRRLKEQLIRRGALHSEVTQAEEVLDPEALTIGFARRFATYKRSTLLFRDPERLMRLLTNRERPVQIIFAGKAHPRDTVAKELIRKIIHHARKEELRRRIIFLEDYDINIARYLVQGCDIWLNTPRRPMEASGTSGMKAAMNAVLNLSIPDGWWPEAYDGKNGWQIGKGEHYPTEEEQDEVECRAIYDILEKEAVPIFYNRGSDGLPRQWIAMMKRTVRTIGPRFSTNRMVQEYSSSCYLPAHRRWQDLVGENLARAKQLTEWKRNMAEQWGQVAFRKIQTLPEGTVPVGAEVGIRAWVHLGRIAPEDVRVEMCYGPLEPEGGLRHKNILPLTCEGPDGDRVHRFTASVRFRTSGGQGLAFRILPFHEDIPSPADTGWIVWA